MLNGINDPMGNVILDGILCENHFMHEAAIEDVKYDYSYCDSLSDYSSSMYMHHCNVLMKIPMDTILLLIMIIRIRRYIFWGMSRNGINGIPLVIMMIFQANLRYTITMVSMVSSLPGVGDIFETIIQCIFRNTAMERYLFKRLTSQLNRYVRNDKRRRNPNLFLGHKWDNISYFVRTFLRGQTYIFEVAN